MIEEEYSQSLQITTKKKSTDITDRLQLSLGAGVYRK